MTSAHLLQEQNVVSEELSSSSNPRSGNNIPVVVLDVADPGDAGHPALAPGVHPPVDSVQLPPIVPPADAQLQRLPQDSVLSPAQQSGTFTAGDCDSVATRGFSLPPASSGPSDGQFPGTPRLGSGAPHLGGGAPDIRGHCQPGGAGTSTLTLEPAAGEGQGGDSAHCGRVSPGGAGPQQPGAERQQPGGQPGAGPQQPGGQPGGEPQHPGGQPSGDRGGDLPGGRRRRDSSPTAPTDRGRRRRNRDDSGYFSRSRSTESRAGQRRPPRAATPRPGPAERTIQAINKIIASSGGARVHRSPKVESVYYRNSANLR